MLVTLGLRSVVHLYMYVCMYVRSYVCMHECMLACMYVRMYVCMYGCTFSSPKIQIFFRFLSSAVESIIALCNAPSKDSAVEADHSAVWNAYPVTESFQTFQ